MTDALPNGELVAQAWIGKYTGIPGGQVAGNLPDVAKWLGADATKGVGFLQVRSLPGGPVDSDLPHRRTSVLQLDGWGTRAVHDTFRPVWGVAMSLLEAVRAATFPDAQTYGKPITMPLAGYQAARVLSAYLLGEPSRVEGDPNGYARLTTNLSITWTV